MKKAILITTVALIPILAASQLFAAEGAPSAPAPQQTAKPVAPLQTPNTVMTPDGASPYIGYNQVFPSTPSANAPSAFERQMPREVKEVLSFNANRSD